MVDLKTIKEIDPELYDSFVKEFDVLDDGAFDIEKMLE